MEYEVVFTNQIPLAEKEANAYKAVAFNGQAYYFTLPQVQSIHMYTRDLSFYTACCCEHAYSAICYDMQNDCFWASCEEHPNRIYCLNNRLKAIDYLSFDDSLSIVSITYHEAHDSLLVCTAEHIFELAKDGQMLHACQTQFPSYLSIYPSHDTYTAIRTTNAFTFLDILSLDGYVLESYPVTITGTPKAILWDHENMLETNLPCFLCLCVKKDKKPCFCQCICKPCDFDPCTCDKDCCPSACIGKVLSSIACMEAALAHILNAEGEKLQKAIQLANDICELLEVNRSISKTITEVTMLEQVLYAKIIAAKEISESNCCECCEEDAS